MPIRRKHIRDLAEKVLAEHRITDAPVDVFQIVKERGIEVKREPAEAELSGFLLRSTEKKKVVIGVNSNQHLNRQRFTVAHELGHFLLHPTGAVHVDRGYTVKLRDEKSSKGIDADEVEANLFAAELLMPAKLLVAGLDESASVDLFNDASLKEVADKFKVSTQALAFRLANLGSNKLPGE